MPHYHFTIFSLLAFAGAVATTLLAVSSSFRRAAREGSAFSFLMAATALYGFGAGFELMATDLSTALLWTHVEYVGIAFIPAAVIIFALRFSGTKVRNERFLIAILAALSLVTLTAQLTSSLHGLYYQNPSMEQSGPILSLRFDMGPFYVYHTAYTITSLTVMTWLVVRRIATTTGLFREQALIIFAGSLMPIIGYVIYILRLLPVQFDINPVTFPLMGLVYALGIRRTKLFDLTPVALQSVFQSMREGCVIFDDRNRIVSYNGAARVPFPGIDDASIGRPAETLAEYYAGLADLIDRAEGQDVDVVSGEGDELKCFNASLSVVRDAKGAVRGKVLILYDTTRQYHLAERLRALATRDELTGLPNRRHFFEVAAQVMNQARRSRRPLSAVIIDIDHFKVINDTYGHQVGDCVLSETAHRLAESIRSSDVLCRYGGEEFLLLLPETPVAAAFEIAERIKRRVEAPAHTVEPHGPVSMTMSVGVACFTPPEEIGLDELIRRADAALYSAKQTGRDKVCVYAPE